MFWWTWSGSNRRPLPCHLRNINHLRAFPPETKDLARGLVDSGGRHGAAFGRLDSTWTPGLHARNGTLRALTRAVAGHCDCCLPETTTIRFLIRMMPRWSGDRHRDCDVSCGLPVREWSKLLQQLLQKSIRWLCGRRRKMSPPPVREDD